MRWDDDGDDGAGGGDDVDDDPDDARGDGDDFPLREGISPADFSLPEPFFSLSGFRLAEAAKKLLDSAPDVFRSRRRSTPKGFRKGATGPKGGSHLQSWVDPRPRADPAPWQASPAHLRPPSLICEENDFLNFLELLGLRRTGVLRGAFPSYFRTSADKSP